MSDLARFGVTMDEALLMRFDEFVARRGTASNRSEAIRDLVREALVGAEWERTDGEVVATVTMVFDHHASDLSEKLDTIQHAHHDKVVSTLHVHLDAHNCLEVLVVRGPAADVSDIAHALLGTKGVKHGGVVTTTAGAAL